MATKAIQEKAKVVDNLKEKLDSASVVILSDYRRVTVKEITGLRKKLHAHGAELRIVKNTLLERAVDKAGFAELKEHIAGPTAVLLGYEEPVVSLKALVEFVKEIEKGEVKAGLLDKAFVDSKQIAEIAKLPPKEVLLAKVVGGLQAPIYGFVNVLQGTIRKLVYALSAVKDKKAQG